METQQGNILQSAQNADRFLTDNAAALGDIVTSGLRQELTGYLTDLSGHVTAQNGYVRKAQSALATRRTKRQALVRDHMAPIARVAHLKLLGTPELLSLSLPKGTPTVEKLAAYAYGMADAATTYTAIFTQAGLRTDFIAQLRTAADDMLSARSDRVSNQGQVRTASTAMRATLAQARKVVAAIDALLTSALVDNPSLLASWKLMKRIPVTGKSAAPATATPAATTPAPVTTPAATTPAPVTTPVPTQA